MLSLEKLRNKKLNLETERDRKVSSILLEYDAKIEVIDELISEETRENVEKELEEDEEFEEVETDPFN